VRDADYVWSGQTAGLAEAPSLQVVVEILPENGEVRSKSAMSVIKFAERRALALWMASALSKAVERLLMGGRCLVEGGRCEMRGLKPRAV
jgi:hypothetical protein